MVTEMWYYNSKPFEDDIDNYDSFVYLITRLSETEELPKYYIGKKTFWFKHKKSVPGKKNKIITKKESDWMQYYGSSDWLNEVIAQEGVQNFRREILHLCKSKGESFILEAKEQIHNNVLSKHFPNGVKMFYNKQILGKYTKEYFTERELLEITSIHNNMNPTNYVWVTDGTTSKKIKYTEQIPSGWELGYHYGKNYCWVNNGIVEKKIPRIDINSLDYRDWDVGRLTSPIKDRVCISKGDVVKYVMKSEVECYISDGWNKGHQNGKTLDERNKIYVCEDDTKQQKLVQRDEASQFLSDNPSWRIGQFKRGKFTTLGKVPAIDLVTGEKVMVCKDEYKNNTRYVARKTRKVKVKKKNRIVFEGFLVNFFEEFDVPENPFKKKLRENDTTPIVLKKGPNKHLNDELWSIREI